MSDMTNLMILLGSSMPTNFIVGKLKEQISIYESDPSDDNLKKLEATCMLLVSSGVAKEHEGGAVGLIREIDSREQMVNMLSPERSKH